MDHRRRRTSRDHPWHQPQPGVYDDAYIGQIKAMVAMLGRHGIVSLLDFHQDEFNELFHGEGAPDWAVEDDGLPNPDLDPLLGFGANQLGDPALQQAYDNFWANSPGPGGVGLEDRYAAMVGHVAEAFSGDRDVLGYDLYNEPFPGTDWESCALTSGCPGEDAQLSAFYDRVIAAIRASNPTTLAFYERGRCTTPVRAPASR